MKAVPFIEEDSPAGGCGGWAWSGVGEELEVPLRQVPEEVLGKQLKIWMGSSGERSRLEP